MITIINIILASKIKNNKTIFNKITIKSKITFQNN